MATILVRVFVDAACMMGPYGTAWRRQKEEAGAECGFHFQAMRQRIGLVVCSEESCEGLGPWKADGVGRILNQVLCLARARTVLWQLASDGVGRRWLVAILLSLRQSLDPGDGYGWVTPWQLLL